MLLSGNNYRIVSGSKGSFMIGYGVSDWQSATIPPPRSVEDVTVLYLSIQLEDIRNCFQNYEVFPSRLKYNYYVFFGLTHACTYTQTRMHARTHTHTHIHACVHTPTHTEIRSRLHRRTQRHSYTNKALSNPYVHNAFIHKHFKSYLK